MLTYTVKTIRMSPCLIACSMQHVSTVSTYPGSCKTCFSRILGFGGNFLLIFSIIYQIAHLHNWPTWPHELFDLCRHLPWMVFSWIPVSTVSTCPRFPVYLTSLLLKFLWVKTCFGCIDSVNIEITVQIHIYLIWSCLNQSTWLLCMRHTRSTTP